MVEQKDRMSITSQPNFLENSFAVEFTSSTGACIRTRLIRPDDAPLLIDLFNHLSPETRHRRFHLSGGNIDSKRLLDTAQELAAVDNRTTGGAVLAFATNRGSDELIGVSRLARPADDRAATMADVAIVVRDDYQGQGIGTLLLKLLFDLAALMGIKTLTATVQADNERVFSMLRKLNVPVKTHTSYNETEMWIELA